MELADEVKAKLAGFDTKILVIEATTEMSFLLEVAKLEPGSKVSFACLGNAGGQWMAMVLEKSSETLLKEATAKNHTKI